MRPSKRYSGRLRNTRSASWVIAVPSSRSPVWLVSSRKKASRQVRPESARRRSASLGDEHLVGVEVHDPVAGGGVEGDVARGGEVAVHSWCRTRAPKLSAISTVRSVEPVSTTTISSTASRAAARQRGEHRLLVLDDHAEAERQALGRAARRRRCARRAGCRSRSAAGDLRRQARSARALAAARTRRGCARRWAASGSRRWAAREERLGGLDGAELVEERRPRS